MKSKDPHSFSSLEQGKITNIDFNFQVDFQNHQIIAKNIYTFDSNISGSLYLDIRDLSIDHIFHEHKELEWEIDKKDEVMGQRLHIKNLHQANSISITYTIFAGASALQWLKPEQTAGKTHPFLFSQCQAIHARSVFPCQDSPSVRFTYSAQVSVPQPLTAVMSAARTDIYTDKENNICTFHMPQPIPSYLFALAVGHITQKDLSDRSRIYAEPEVVEDAAWEFGETEKMISEAEKLFGPYVWDRFDMLLMPPSFPYGGMENPRLTFLTPTLLVGDRSMANVVAHELAHSWTGNLVTNATWEDFWLNEGWTVYAERRILENLDGSEYANLQGALRRNSMLKDMELFGVDSKPTCLKFSQEGIDPDDVFSTIPYEKGFAFLNRIETQVGREIFDPFIQKYINHFQFQSISTEDFLSFLKQNFSGIDQTIDIQRWVYKPGFPDDAVAIKSVLMDEVFTAVKQLTNNEELEKEKISKWKSEQKILFLQSLPRTLSSEELAMLGDLLTIAKTNNYSILTEYYLIAIKSGYQVVLPGVENILSSVGRMLYLKPLYRSLSEAEWSKNLVRDIFEKNKETYHPIAGAGIESIIKSEGL